MSLEKDDLDNYKFNIDVFKYRRDIRVEFICWWENNYFIGRVKVWCCVWFVYLVLSVFMFVLLSDRFYFIKGFIWLF